jgi:hypothetical protein
MEDNHVKNCMEITIPKNLGENREIKHKINYFIIIIYYYLYIIFITLYGDNYVDQKLMVLYVISLVK